MTYTIIKHLRQGINKKVWRLHFFIASNQRISYTYSMNTILLILVKILLIPNYLYQVISPKTVLYELDEFNNNRIAIENSLVKIEGRGSGTFIHVKGKNFVLTNAHVCLSPYLDEIMNKGLQDKEFSYEIKSKHEQMFISANQADLKYNLKEDWCQIPVQFQFKYSIISHNFLEEKMSNKAYTLTYNRQLNTSKFDFFSGCVTDGDIETNKHVDKFFCQFSPKIQDPSYLTFTNRKKQQKSMYLDKHYVYQFPTIAGDSGSPVYNQKLELIGLVTGRRGSPDDDSVTLWAHVTPIVSFKKDLKK